MCFAMLFMCISTALAQTKISGTVVSADDNEPVIGATIMVVGTKSGAVTDVDGKFSLTADVLNRHTRCLTFKRTADICHTTQACLLSINLVRSTRKETAVGASKTHHNNLVQCLSA